MVTFLLCSAWVIIFSKLLSAALAVSLPYPLGWRAGRMLNPMYPNQWIIAFLVVYFIPLDQEPSNPIPHVLPSSVHADYYLKFPVVIIFLPCCPHIPSLLKMRQPKLYAWGEVSDESCCHLVFEKNIQYLSKSGDVGGTSSKKECYSSSRSSKGIGRSANHNL